jgi:predicted nuclease with TOPRIM domain
MANGYDCKQHQGVLDRLKTLETSLTRNDERIKYLEREQSEMSEKLDRAVNEIGKLREQLASMPMKIVISTVGLTSALTAIIVKFM